MGVRESIGEVRVGDRRAGESSGDCGIEGVVTVGVSITDAANAKWLIVGVIEKFSISDE